MCMIRHKSWVYEDGQLKSKLVPTRFDCGTIKQFIADAEENGYEMEFLREGVCGLGTFILWGPNNDYQNFLIREVYDTEWSSRHTVEKFKTMNKTTQREVDILRAEMEEC